MIINEFEKQVKQFPNQEVIRAGNKTLTYSELDHDSNRLARQLMLIDKDNQDLGDNIVNSNVSLLFDHGADMIIGILGVLKAGKTYVPLDVNYPQKRLLYMLAHSGSFLILTGSKNLPLAEALAAQSGTKIPVSAIDRIPDEISGSGIEREVIGNRPAYILYTSGSTGRPRGVVQAHESVLHFIHHWAHRFSITAGDRITLLSSLSHDGSVPDIFTALLKGAVLYPYDIKKQSGIDELAEWLRKEKITVWHSVPTFYRYFLRMLSGDERFPGVRLIVLGGEEVRPDDVEMTRKHFPGATFANIYGQTESTVNSIWLLSPADSFKKVIIGEPIGNTGIVLVDESGGMVEQLGTGEIVIASDHVARGYWQDEEASQKVFTFDSELGRLYWTGDLGRLTADGNISFLGRKDFQVKLRGFRVELGEIEAQLSSHQAVKEVAVIVREENHTGSNVYAYITSDHSISPEELRAFLSAELPDYMVPGNFITLEKMPLTANGKIDRQALPEPAGITGEIEESQAPANEIEKSITVMWQEILGVEKIGTHANFFALGGHSLLVLTLISKIHHTFDIKIELKDVFDNPTIRELSRLIIKSGRKIFLAIEPVEEREYYPMSSAQKRLLILQQSKLDNITYNLPLVLVLEGEFDIRRMTGAFGKLIERHESLRTSFIVLGNEPVQRVHRDKFTMPITTYKGDSDIEGSLSIEKLIRKFVRSFDLSRAPLLRVGLIKAEDRKYFLMVDMHHIISDGMSSRIMVSEFNELYRGGSLPQLKLQYKDFTGWQDNLCQAGEVKKQEAYWLKELSSPLPVLKLPCDFQRPLLQQFTGSTVEFELTGLEQFKHLAGAERVTMFTLLFALFNVFLFKLSGQEDIIVGAVTVGRRHPDLEPVIGMFVNTLALRNYPGQDKSFIDFLREVNRRTLDALDNQDYQFNQLVETLLLNRDGSRNPLFDVMFTYAPGSVLTSRGNPGETGNPVLRVRQYDLELNQGKFDMILAAYEREVEDRLEFVIQYSPELFKASTIEKFARYFKRMVFSVLENNSILLGEIKLGHDLKPLASSVYQSSDNKFDF